MVSKTESYIIHTYRVPSSVNKEVGNLLEGFSKEDRHFFVHTLLSTQLNIRELEGWTPIPAKTIWNKWTGKVDIKGLIEVGLIEIRVISETTYSVSQKVCRHYRVPEPILELILNSYPKTTKEFETCCYYNLVNGRKMNKSNRHKLSDNNNNSLRKLVKEAILSQERCVIDSSAIEEHLEELEFEIDFGFCSNKAKKRFLIDKTAFNNLRCSGIICLENGLAQYEPSYTMQKYGRISEQGSGMQSCTREMKKAGFSTIPNVRNYDIVNSQPSILVQQLEEAGIDSTWLEEYIVKDKTYYSYQVNVSKDCWKRCFMALIMGGSIDTKPDVDEEPSNKINEYIWEESKLKGDREGEVDIEAYLHKVTKFNEVTSKLQETLKAWHNWIIETYIPRHAIYPRGRKSLVNKTGTTFDISDFITKEGKYQTINKLKRQLAAFLLQGAEAAFIFELSVVADYYNYEVISNQHDGLVTIGEVPIEAKEYAKTMTGLKYIVLEEKPFI